MPAIPLNCSASPPAAKPLVLWFAAFVAFGHLCLAQDVFLTGGKLVDPRTRTVREANLLIEDGMIAGSPARAPEGFDGTVLDVSGRWIIPGLHDLHTHSVLNRAPGGVSEMLGTEIVARRLLYAGVTGFLDLFNDERYVFALRDRQRTAGQLSGVADIHAAGACLTATGGHGTEYPIPARIIDTPADAKRQVDDLAAHRPDVVKIIYDNLSEEAQAKTWRTVMPSIDEPTLRAAVAAAAEHGIPTVVHIRSWQDVRDAVAAGADAITHLPSEGPVPADLLEQMATTGTTVIATLAVGDTAFIDRPEVFDSPMVRALTNDAVVAAYRQFGPSETGQRTLAGLRPAQAARLEIIRQLSEAGVPLATGTDAGNWFTIQGYSLHRELAMMAEAGLTPWDVLASATTVAGDFLGRPVGLAAGDLGSVVVLDASPLEDIRNTERITRVIHHGVVLDRSALRAQPDDVWRPPMPQAAP